MGIKYGRTKYGGIRFGAATRPCRSPLPHNMAHMQNCCWWRVAFPVMINPMPNATPTSPLGATPQSVAVNPARAITLKLLSLVVFAGMITCIKFVGQAVPVGEIVFFRSAFAIPVIIVWLILQHDLRDGLSTANPMGHVWRGLIGTAAMAAGFTALGLLPLPDARAISYAAPLIVVVLAAIFLGERIRLFRISAVLIGFVGVLIILAPRLSLGNLTGAQSLGAVVALLGAILMAFAQIAARRLVRTEKTPTIVFYFSAFAALLSLVSIPFGWVMPSVEVLILLILSGLLGGIGQILLTSSYRFAPTGVIAPFEYVSMLLALGIGFLAFDEIPSRQTIIGAAIIITSGLVIIFRERQLGLSRSKSRSTARSVSPPQG